MRLRHDGRSEEFGLDRSRRLAGAGRQHEDGCQRQDGGNSIVGHGRTLATTPGRRIVPLYEPGPACRLLPWLLNPDPHPIARIPCKTASLATARRWLPAPRPASAWPSHRHLPPPVHGSRSAASAATSKSATHWRASMLRAPTDRNISPPTCATLPPSRR